MSVGMQGKNLTVNVKSPTHESTIVQSVKIVRSVTRTMQSYHTAHFLLNDTLQMKMLPTTHDPVMVHLNLLPDHRQVLNSPYNHAHTKQEGNKMVLHQ